MDKNGKLVYGGSVINRATPSCLEMDMVLVQVLDQMDWPSKPLRNFMFVITGQIEFTENISERQHFGLDL